MSAAAMMSDPGALLVLAAVVGFDACGLAPAYLTAAYRRLTFEIGNGIKSARCTWKGDR